MLYFVKCSIAKLWHGDNAKLRYIKYNALFCKLRHAIMRIPIRQIQCFILQISTVRYCEIATYHNFALSKCCNLQNTSNTILDFKNCDIAKLWYVKHCFWGILFSQYRNLQNKALDLTHRSCSMLHFTK